ncbi:MAG: hypothetical protein U9R72_06385 [Chloroflexota bacterium]|nr:hypothetical protein [Chloroflexota bacterium]
MRRRLSSWAFLLIALMAIGLMVGRWLWNPSDLPPPTSFRAWWWESRELDVAVQVGLVFAGALGIAALMPPEAKGAE